MGFVIGFPLLILTTIVLIIFYAITQKKNVGIIIFLIWVFAILIVVTGFIKDYYNQPIRLTKAEIVGSYYIDTNFFPGKNADWQYNHYRFTITPTDSIYFYITNKDTILKIFKEKLKYSTGPPALWSVRSDTAYRIIQHPPTLYRGHRKFYYVIHSNRYGNMFFRKQKNN